MPWDRKSRCGGLLQTPKNILKTTVKTTALISPPAPNLHKICVTFLNKNGNIFVATTKCEKEIIGLIVKGGDILARVEKSIEINVSPEKVWPMMAWERLPEWYDPMKKVDWTSKDKNKVGATVHVVGELAGRKGRLGC